MSNREWKTIKEYSDIKFDFYNGIARIMINRPEVYNAFTPQTNMDMIDAMDIAKESQEVGVIVLTGVGDKAFCSGGDQNVKGEGGYIGKDGVPRLNVLDLHKRIREIPKPVIAAVNGFALGGGLELAMSCHFRLASDNAKLGLPEVTLGVIPGYGGTQRLAQLVGKGRAMEMIMTAKMVTADEALSYGLVNQVTSQEELMAACKKIALKIVKNSSVAIASAIRAVNAGYTDGVNGFETEIEEFGKCFGTEDFKEGTTAFIEKRKANFSGK